MQVEKFIAYLFLTFILLVASFNIISSLSMLMIEKQENVATLRSLGASEGSFVVDAYPVSIQATDLLLTFLTVLLVGLVAVWLPVRRMTRNLLAA